MIYNVNRTKYIIIFSYLQKLQIRPCIYKRKWGIHKIESRKLEAQAPATGIWPNPRGSYPFLAFIFPTSPLEILSHFHFPLPLPSLRPSLPSPTQVRSTFYSAFFRSLISAIFLLPLSDSTPSSIFLHCVNSVRIWHSTISIFFFFSYDLGFTFSFAISYFCSLFC